MRVARKRKLEEDATSGACAIATSGRVVQRQVAFGERRQTRVVGAECHVVWTELERSATAYFGDVR